MTAVCGLRGTNMSNLFEDWAENESPLGESFEIDDLNLEVVEITDDNRKDLLEIVLSGYLDEPCRFCGGRYETTADLKDTIWDGQWPMHPHCFEQLKKMSVEERRALGFEV